MKEWSSSSITHCHPVGCHKNLSTILYTPPTTAIYTVVAARVDALVKKLREPEALFSQQAVKHNATSIFVRIVK